MKLMSDSGLWSTGPQVAPSPLVAVLEVSGAVLSWTVDDPGRRRSDHVHRSSRADWLWRVLGEPGTAHVAAAVDGRHTRRRATVELTGVDVLPGSLDPLRRLALGHWLRRWWPASQRDGIAVLDAALLDAEIALLTAAARGLLHRRHLRLGRGRDYLRPHAAALNAHVQQGDPRVVELVRKCTDLADDVGVVFEATVAAAASRRLRARRRGRYRQVHTRRRSRRVSSSVEWVSRAFRHLRRGREHRRLERRSRRRDVTAVVRVALSGLGSPNGIAVRLRSGALRW